MEAAQLNAFLIGLPVKTVWLAFSCVRVPAEYKVCFFFQKWNVPQDVLNVSSFCLFYCCLTTVDSEDGVAIEAPGTLNLDTEFLLGHDLEFDHNGKILNLDKFSGV